MTRVSFDAYVHYEIENILTFEIKLWIPFVFVCGRSGGGFQGHATRVVYFRLNVMGKQKGRCLQIKIKSE